MATATHPSKKMVEVEDPEGYKARGEFVGFVTDLDGRKIVVRGEDGLERWVLASGAKVRPL